MTKNLRTFLIALIVAGLPLAALAQEEFMVPMADGTPLRTVVYKPSTDAPSWPVVLERPPLSPSLERVALDGPGLGLCCAERARTVWERR